VAPLALLPGRLALVALLASPIRCFFATAIEVLARLPGGG
jgi:hypothetical protein